MNKNLLQSVGLTENEVTIYDLLLSHKCLKASDISDRSGVSRTNTYAVLNSLVKKNLVHENDKKTNLLYSVTAPENLKVYAKQKLKELETNVEGVESYLPHLQDRYEALINVEGARHYEGILGLELVFEDILREKRNLHLIASNFQNKRKSVLALYKEQLVRQDKLGIKMEILIPSEAEFTYNFFTKITKEFTNIEIKRFDEKIPCLDADIFIYGSNCALISQKSDFNTNQLDNRDISHTLKHLFSFIWNQY